MVANWCGRVELAAGSLSPGQVSFGHLIEVVEQDSGREAVCSILVSIFQWFLLLFQRMEYYCKYQAAKGRNGPCGPDATELLAKFPL